MESGPEKAARVSAEEIKAPAGEALSSRRLAAIVAAALTCGFLLSFFFVPSEAKPNGNYFTICGFKNFTGLPCPGCGLTHSICAIGAGDLMLALEFNLLGPPLYLLAILVWVRSACVLLNWRSLAYAFDRLASRLRVVRAFIVAFLLFGLGRILYLLIYQPAGFPESPLARLITRVIGS